MPDLVGISPTRMHTRKWPTPSTRGAQPFLRRPFRKPRPGYAEVYGAIIHCRATGAFCFVQGRRTGKWSFPKGHLKESNESPFECVTREVGEEIGYDELPTPLRGMPGSGTITCLRSPMSLPWPRGIRTRWGRRGGSPWSRCAK